MIFAKSGRLFQTGKKLTRNGVHMENKMKIMIVEDDGALAGEIRLFLARWEYEAVMAEQFDRIADEFSAFMPKLVLLDINLPYSDGFYWCRQIRQISDVPILFISSRGGDVDKIMAIAQGGDDYIEKPFRPELLRAKIEAILRRTYKYEVKDRILLREGVFFDCDTECMYYNGEEVVLTKLERRIITKLSKKRGSIVTREELMLDLWDTDEYVSDGTLTTGISRLRTKLRAVLGDELIQTRKGHGYFIQ